MDFVYARELDGVCQWTVNQRSLPTAEKRRSTYAVARISKIDAENDALILSAGDQEITASSFSLLRQGQPCRSRQEFCRVAVRACHDERFPGLARLGPDPHTASG